MNRVASVISLKRDKVEEYKRLHVAVWPEIGRIISEANMRNYSIYCRELPDGKFYLFSYFEYVGEDIKVDMERMAGYEIMQCWWSLCGPCQDPLDDRESGEWWAGMTEVFHQD
jgi:L-rhamnose mutarotase